VKKISLSESDNR